MSAHHSFERARTPYNIVPPNLTSFPSFPTSTTTYAGHTILHTESFNTPTYLTHHSDMASQSQPYRWLTTTSEGLTFRSCGIGDLEEMLHTIKNAPSFALGMKRIDLSLAYDTARDSRFVEFAEGWAADRGIEVDVRPDTDGDFESEGEGEKEVGDDVSFLDGGLLRRC
jgi:hypothetical protein